MRKFIYSGLAVLGITLTFAAVPYAYAERGYFAIGSEYMLLLLPAIGFAIDCLMVDDEEEV